MDTHVIAPVASNGRALSPFWNGCPMSAIRNDPGFGFYQEDDFSNGILIPTITTTIGVNGYNMFGSSGATITYDDAAGGAIVLAETTNDESVNITTEQHPFRITEAGGELWFECRFKMSHTATTENSFAVGLMDTTATTAIVPLTATGAIADINFVGFHKPEANTTAFDASYKADGVTLVEVNSDIGTLVAATYVKVGFHFGGAGNPVLSFYVNGVKQTSTKTIPNATGTDFPADIGLGIVLAMSVGAAASDNTMSVDWYKCFQRSV